MKQLAAARAVVTIWTPNSVKSDWVRAEAGAAKANGKLIPVKTPDVAYADIPLPFGEMHTENIALTELIRAAVVAQLAKPAVEPSPWALLTKGFRYELLTWVGIVGGALTLFTALSAVLKLADWARVFVEHWKAWTHAFWVWVFGWLGIHVWPEWPPVLSFFLFCLLLTLGQAVNFHTVIKQRTIKSRYHGKAFQLISWRTLFFVVSIITAEITVSFWMPVAERIVQRSATYVLGDLEWEASKWQLYIWSALPAVPVVILVLIFSHHKLHATVTALLMALFWTIIVETQRGSWSPLTPLASYVAASRTAKAMIYVVPLILLSVAPARAVTRRLIFLALGLLLLIALNELSKLGLDVTAPKL